MVSENTLYSWYSFRQLSQMSEKQVKLFLSGYLPCNDNLFPPTYYLPYFIKAYPNFPDWLNSKVFPEMTIDPLQRNVILILDSKSNQTVGFAILKNTVDEKKICSFYIRPDFRCKGFGSCLMKKCIDFLNLSSSIIITVSEYYRKSFTVFLQKFDFQCIHDLSDLYVSGITEYVFQRKSQERNKINESSSIE